MPLKQDTTYGMGEARCESKVICRNDFIFVSGAIAVLAGLLFALPTYVLDVLLIFNASLTAAVIMIALSAQGTLQVQSFPLLIVLVTTLRMALSVACAKTTLLEGYAGTIVRLLGQIVASGNLMFTVTVFGLLVTAIFAIVCKAVKDINHAGTEFVSDVVPIRQAVIHSDLTSRIINETEALGLRTTISREQSFFVGMTGAAKFILCSAVIELVIVSLSVTASMGMKVATATPAGTYTASAVGAGTITQVSLLIIALASAHLVRKSFVVPTVWDEPSASQLREGERIKVIAEEVVSPQESGLQFDTTLTLTKSVAMVESQFVEGELSEVNRTTIDTGFAPGENAIANDTACLSESANRGAGNRARDSVLWAWREIRDNSRYQAIAELIRGKCGGKIKTLLMAAEGVAGLPVTIPVNIALCLARKERRCLLVDLDTERNAIAKVFENDNKGPDAKHGPLGTPTCISNLWIWPASGFGKANGGHDLLNLKNLITSVEDRYDHLIIHAPNIKPTVRWEQAASSIHLAMLFGKAEHDAANTALGGLHRLLTDSGCNILRPAEVSAKAI
jgi:hypothetical protein